jgi:hypothetical protein
MVALIRIGFATTRRSSSSVQEIFIYVAYLHAVNQLADGVKPWILTSITFTLLYIDYTAHLALLDLLANIYMHLHVNQSRQRFFTGPASSVKFSEGECRRHSLSDRQYVSLQCLA